MKGGETAEIEALRLIPEISVARCDKEYPFTCDMSETDRAELSQCHNRLLDEAFACGADMVILDELCCAYNFGLLDKSAAEALILRYSVISDVVLTGRGPNEKFLEAADYISEISCIKHPYKKAATPRKGIEY